MKYLWGTLLALAVLFVLIGVIYLSMEGGGDDGSPYMSMVSK